MVVVIMGVSGSGKTTIGRLLAERLGWEFHDADDYHPDLNIQKMSQGIPLNDKDRQPWLRILRELIQDKLEQGQEVVLACSALKESHRERLKVGDPGVRFVYLITDQSLARQRLAGRDGHFMPADLVQSQFEALEEPERAIAVPAAWPPERIVDRICHELDQDS